MQVQVVFGQPAYPTTSLDHSIVKYGLILILRFFRVFRVRDLVFV
jgi:hypothetical protein